MYRKHFGLNGNPFDKNLPPEDFFLSAAGKELDARLKYLFELRGIGLVTGDTGSGKTSAVRKAFASLHTGLYRVCYVPNSTGTAMDLYKTIAWELGLETERNRASLYRSIRNEVSRLCLDARIQPVLAVDEAHNLRNDVIDDLRVLTNYEMDSQDRLCLLLIGQTELRRRLSLSVHESLAGRIVVRQHLEGLTREELPLYLVHLLRRAGTELPLFEPAAFEAIFQATNGLPRKVNLLAHHALLVAAQAKAKNVTAEHVQAALEEIS